MIGQSLSKNSPAGFERHPRGSNVLAFCKLSKCVSQLSQFFVYAHMDDSSSTSVTTSSFQKLQQGYAVPEGDGSPKESKVAGSGLLKTVSGESLFSAAEADGMGMRRRRNVSFTGSRGSLMDGTREIFGSAPIDGFWDDGASDAGSVAAGEAGDVVSGTAASGCQSCGTTRFS